MSGKISRREMLARGLGATALLAGGRFPAALAAEQAVAVKPAMPDRSAQAPTSPVSIQRCESYDPKVVREKLDACLDQIGGIEKLVRDKTVTIKMNLTGRAEEMLGRPACRTYHIHPNVAAALCAAIHEAGAKRIVLVEAYYYSEPVEQVLTIAGWDVAGVKSAGGQKVVLENTKNRGSWPNYGRINVPWGGFLFPAFDVNQWYVKTDVFVSLSKLKNHACAGVTAATKNLFGMTPTALYGSDAPNEDTLQARGAIIHDGKKTVPAGVPGEIDHKLPADWRYRVPRVTADVLGARPVDLAVIDGIHTIRGGEGPWNKGVEAVEPKLLLVGRNAVCTDAVCTAVMGYDPQADHMQFPFPGQNHLRLLASVGVGTIDVKRIEVVGLPVQKALFPFGGKPAADQKTARSDRRIAAGSCSFKSIRA